MAFNLPHHWAELVVWGIFVKVICVKVKCVTLLARFCVTSFVSERDGTVFHPMEDIPWDLKGYANGHLGKRELEELCRLCTARSITPGGTKELCVERLLQWKQELKDGAHSPDPPSGNDGAVSGAAAATTVATVTAPASASSRGAPRAVYSTFQQHNYGEWRSKLKDLARGDVRCHCDKLLAKQRGNGAYSLRPLGGAAHTTNAPEVDHIFECQAMGDLLFRVDALRPVLRQLSWEAKNFEGQPMVVQNALAHAREVHNRPEFLAVCGSLENKKKQGAFQSSLNTLAQGNRLENGLEESLRANFGRGVDPFESTQARQMARTVVDLLRGLEDPFTAALREVPQGAAQGREQQARYDELADEVVLLYEHFDITRRV